MNGNAEKPDHVKTIRELLGMDADFPLPSGPAGPTAPAPALNLPVAHWEMEKAIAARAEQAVTDVHEPAALELEPALKAGHAAAEFLSRDWVRYPLIFFVALGFFYLVLNLQGVSKQVFSFLRPPASNEKAVLGQSQADYNSWIKKYYVYVNDQGILAANADPDHDGLTNFDEFKLGTNPLKPDTDTDGRDDGLEVLASANPLYEGGLTQIQRNYVDANIDSSAVASRRQFQSQSGVAGARYPVENFALDPSRPGEISIPKLGVAAPIIWTKDFSKIQDDLKYGVAHHPATPYPGARGTSSIHGHSSGNWDDGNYKTVFTRINFLEAGDEVFVTVYSTTNEARRYRFLVRSKKVFAKDDQAQFEQLPGYFLNVSTSWPVGTARERYVVTTELAGL